MVQVLLGSGPGVFGLGDVGDRLVDALGPGDRLGVELETALACRSDPTLALTRASRLSLGGH
jgi:hypothetical protein